MYRFKQTLVVGLFFSMALTGLGLSLRAAERTTEKASWISLNRLAPGQPVLVALKGAQAFQGQFKTVTDDAIEVHLATGDRTFPRANVFRVSNRGQSHRGRNALIGVLVGAGAGLGVGLATDKSSQCGPSGPFLCGLGSSNYGKEIFTPVGAVVGAVVGVALTRGGWVELYRVDESPIR